MRSDLPEDVMRLAAETCVEHEYSAKNADATWSSVCLAIAEGIMADRAARIRSCLLDKPEAVEGEERVARLIYEAMRVAAHEHDPGRKTPEWVERGNSLMQDEARRVARSIAALRGEETIYWSGSEDEQERELTKACAARCRQWGKEDCPRPDHFCTECEMDMAFALRTIDPDIDASLSTPADTDAAQGEIDRLRRELEEARKALETAQRQAFTDAAEMAEFLASEEDEEWRSDCGGTIETRLAGARSWAFGRMANILFDKAEKARAALRAGEEGK